MNDPLTPLEREMVRLTAEKNWPGFRVDGLSVTKRENTGAGRYTYLEDAHHQPLADGLYGVDYSEVEMEGVDNGLGWVVDVSNGRLLFLGRRGAPLEDPLTLTPPPVRPSAGTA